MDLIKIGKYLADLRKGKGLTQLELSREINVSDKTISKWESGNGLPEAESLLRLADFFGVTVDQILRSGFTDDNEEEFTEIIMIIDKSGSMGALKSDTIGSFNSFLSEQQKEKDNAHLTLVLFNHEYYIKYLSVNIQDILPFTERDYIPSGMTALYDAVGKTIDEYLKKEKQAQKVMMVIMTDGYENSSKEYTSAIVKEKIELVKNKYNWEVLFFGANIDVDKVADNLSIDKDRRVQYDVNSDDINLNYDRISTLSSMYRKTGKIDDNWLKDLNEKNNNKNKDNK